MSAKYKKTVATIAIVAFSLIMYYLFLYYEGNHEKSVEMYTPILFAIIPAVVINAIWYNKSKKA